MRVKESTCQVTMNRWEVFVFIGYQAERTMGSASLQLQYANCKTSEIWMGCEIMCSGGPESLVGPDTLT